MDEEGGYCGDAIATGDFSEGDNMDSGLSLCLRTTPTMTRCSRCS
ncbi:hypothetical protein PI125_g19912 [Phytophthora idaei]|nr:hypothetical protein PI125_g19912 [Phytophthora idaei]